MNQQTSGRSQSRAVWLAARAAPLLLAVSVLSVAPLRVRPAHADLAAPLALGQVYSTSTTETQCPSGYTCTGYVVVCPNVREPLNAFLAVADPQTGPIQGVLMWFTGGTGSKYWSGQSADNATYLEHIRTTYHYKIVQLRWPTGWETSAAGEVVGPALTGCRPSSMVKYAYDTIYTPLGITAPSVGVCGFCLVGTSGGATQATYPLTHYGLSNLIDAVFPVSGPTHAAMAKGCLRNRWESQYWYGSQGPSVTEIDGPYGFVTNTGPCKVHDPTWQSHWDADSVDTQGYSYNYPTTRVHMIVGGQDLGMQAHVGDFVRRLALAGSPYITYQVIAKMGHNLISSTDGLNALETAITATDSSKFTQCNNGIDDDGDGKTDYPNDPGCSSPTDNWEHDPNGPACDNGTDDDGDGKVDYPSDAGCTSPSDTSEREPTLKCDNGIDDDGDGFTDFPADQGCAANTDNNEHDTKLLCDNGIDDDKDGFTDFNTNSSLSDPGCSSQTAPSERPPLGPTCDNGIDDDGNGLTDYKSDGTGDSACTSPASNAETPSFCCLSLSDASATEGAKGTTTVMPFTLTLDVPPTRSVTVGYATQDDTATAGLDYVATSGTVTFNPDETSKTITVTVIGDALNESNETFSVNLTSANGAGITRGTAIGTIMDDDAMPNVTAATVQVKEGNSGIKLAQILFKLSAASGQWITFSFASADGTATAGSDYASTSGTFTFLPGMTTEKLSVIVYGDTTKEPNESFFVNLSNPVNVVLGTQSVKGTIVNDD